MWYRVASQSDSPSPKDFEIREYTDGAGITQIRFWSRTRRGQAFLEEHCAELKPVSLPGGQDFVDLLCDEARKAKVSYAKVAD